MLCDDQWHLVIKAEWYFESLTKVNIESHKNRTDNKSEKFICKRSNNQF